MDALNLQISGQKPRNYRLKARRDFLKVSKVRKKSEKVMCKAIGKQHRYVRRDLKIMQHLQQNGVSFRQSRERSCRPL